MERNATCETEGFFISTILMPYLLRVNVSLFIFLDPLPFVISGQNSFKGRAVTPHVTEILNQFLNPQLSPKARTNQVTKV
jgi:hypothetical protein